MTQGVWYSSISLLMVAGTQEVDYAFLFSMADDGLLERGVGFDAQDGKYKGHYWRKPYAKS
jgi:hypothetical protein